MNNGRDIVVIGLGACTAVGANVLSTAAAVRAGISNPCEHPSMTDEAGEPAVVAAAPFIDPELDGRARFLALARRSSDEALTALSGATQTPSIAVVVGLPEVRPGLPSGLEQQVRDGLAVAIGKVAHVATVRAATTGHAGGLLALKYGCDLVARGEARFCLVGGVESWLDPTTLKWLDSVERLHSERTRWGFCPGEAAGFCLVCSREEAERLRAPIWAEIVEVASALEQNRIMTETVCIGEGLTAACRDVLGGLAEPATVDHTICDMNGEPYRADEYGFMMARLGRRFAEESGFETPALSWGDVGAASGPLFLVLAAIAAKKRYAKGSLTLLFAGSDGGRRAAALIRTPVNGQ